MSAGSPRIVFLHSIWRARSTWLFSRFRASPNGFRCYYEPLNESLATLTRTAIANEPRERGEGLRHPPLESDGYWAEYDDLLLDPGPGIEGYASRFAFHPFAKNNDPAPFFRRLIQAAGGADVLLELCRSPFRLRWLVDRFPDATHYYLERNPDDQFASYSARPDYFLPAHLAYARLQPALADAVAGEFAGLMPGFWGHRRYGDDFRSWRRHFRRALAAASEQTRRAVFQHLWQAARDDARGADLRFVDMDDREDIQQAFASYGLSVEDYDPRTGGEAGRR